MNFSTFFSEQSRKPTGLFGQLIMSIIFNQGNNVLNNLTYDLLSVHSDDYILEIGFGTGKLIKKIAHTIVGGLITGIDFSETMFLIAENKNKEYIQKKTVELINGDFNNYFFNGKHFTKIYSVNTLYFWPNFEDTFLKITNLIEPKGKIILSFEDIEQLKKRNLDNKILHLYAKEEILTISKNIGQYNSISIESIKRGSSIFHCLVVVK